VPTVPAGNEVVVMISEAGMMTRLNEVCFACPCCPLSVTRTVKLEVPAAVGVPAIVAPLSVRPAGNEPDVTAQRYGGVPPLAIKSVEYGEPTVPSGKEDVVMANAGSILMLRSLSADWVFGKEKKLTRTLKLDVPTVVGVPLMVPVAESSNRPDGSDPETMDQSYCGFPPVAVSFWL